MTGQNNGVFYGDTKVAVPVENMPFPGIGAWLASADIDDSELEV